MNSGKNYKYGFTLAEAILALLIMILIVNLTIMAVKATKHKAEADFEDKITEVVQDLESKRHDFRLKEVRPNRLILYSEVQKKRYELEYYSRKNMLRYTPGHMPLMPGVRAVSFKRVGNLVQIKMKVYGGNYSAYAFIPPAEKES